MNSVIWYEGRSRSFGPVVVDDICEVFEQRATVEVWRRKSFRVELYAIERLCFVSHPFDLAVCTRGNELEISGQLLDFARVGASHQHVLWQPLEKRILPHLLDGKYTIRKVTVLEFWIGGGSTREVLVRSKFSNDWIAKGFGFSQVLVVGKSKHLVAPAETEDRYLRLV